MKLYLELIKFVFNKFVRRFSTGESLKVFCQNQGVVYIKFAQILATQNFGNLFTEEDRKIISSICDNVNPVSFDIIRKCLEREYDGRIDDIFYFIDDENIGSASISQVHKAYLVSGEEVAIKVKRLDVTRKIDKDIKRIKRLIHIFGRFFSFKNIIGGDKALDLYLSWIYEEINFKNEVRNIKTYGEFADSVNGKIGDTVNIKVPKVYEEFCTDNVIVMEFISSKTINQLELTESVNEKIIKCINSYLQLSFYALFHDEKIVFHGDPHSGNIYIDDDGNVGFLDLGLIFELSNEDKELTKEFFFNVYTGNYEKLYDMVVIYGKLNFKDKLNFKNDIKEYSMNAKNKTVTEWFTDLIFVCLKYNISPPTFLFCMAKAFICLNGINGFSQNYTKAISLLEEQTIEYYLNRSLSDCKQLIKDGIVLGPTLTKNTIKHGLVNALSKESVQVLKIRDNLRSTLTHVEDIIDIMNASK